MDVVVELCAVIVAVRDGRPWVLTVDRHGLPALPSGDLDPGRDRTLDRAMRRWSADQTGLELGFVEQLYTFGDLDRDAGAASARGERRLSVAYLAFVGGGAPRLPVVHDAAWLDVYALLPWEDRRAGEPSVIADTVRPALARWRSDASDDAEHEARNERADLAWGIAAAGWDAVRTLERYEMLYELGVVGEAGGPLGLVAALDHRRILASALGRLRGKLTYRPVVFELLAPTFTLSQLQQLVEALVGVPLHKQNFRRLVEGGGLVEGTGVRTDGTGGRPAELFRFRRDVIRERPTPGLGVGRRR